MDRKRLNCRACRSSFMEPDSGLICGHPSMGSVGQTIRSEQPPPCGEGHRFFAQHPLRNPDGTLRNLPAGETLPAIVCLCGSGRFAEDFAHANAEHTLRGNIVLAPGVFGKAALSPAQARALDALHFEKIRMSTFVHVLNIGGYIGESTANEIRFALAHGKPLVFHDPTSGEQWIKENVREVVGDSKTVDAGESLLHRYLRLIEIPTDSYIHHEKGCQQLNDGKAACLCARSDLLRLWETVLRACEDKLRTSGRFINPALLWQSQLTCKVCGRVLSEAPEVNNHGKVWRCSPCGLLYLDAEIKGD